MLGDDHEIIGYAFSFNGALGLINSLKDRKDEPTLAIIDDKLGGDGGAGLRIAEEIRKQLPETVILSLTDQEQNFGDFNIKKTASAQIISETIKSI